MIKCQECGAPLEKGKSCGDYFNQILAWEFQDFSGAGSIHHLSVLTYNLQHPSTYSPEGLRYAKQLFSEIIEHGLGDIAKYQTHRHGISSDERTWKVVGKPGQHGAYAKPQQWPKTIRDVVEGPLEKYPDRVRTWAKSIYDTLKQAGEFDLDRDVNK